MDTKSSEWFGSQTPPNRRFALFLPSRNKEGEAIQSFEKVSEVTAHTLCGLFGGVTRYPATGMFHRETGATQKEEVVVLECFCEVEKWNRNSPSVLRLVRLLSGLLDQESVACSLDGEMIFVSPAEGDLRLNGEIDEEALVKLLGDNLGEQSFEKNDAPAFS